MTSLLAIYQNRTYGFIKSNFRQDLHINCFVQMSEPRKEEATGKGEEPQNKEENVKSNPFASYQSSNPPAEVKKDTSNTPVPPEKPESQLKSNNESPKNKIKDSKQQESMTLVKKDEGHQAPADQEGEGNGGREGSKNPAPVTLENMYDEQVTYFKTKMCPLYSKGACKKGEQCSFAHGEKELRGLPNFRKTRLCQPFKIGQCPKASEDCKYAHGQAELRRVAYDYIPEKGRKRPDRSFDRSNDRNTRRPKEDIDSRREGHRVHKDSRDRRDDYYREHRDYRGERERDRDRQYRDRSREYRDRDRDYRDKEREYRERERDRYREERQRYNLDYPSRNSQMYSIPPPGYSYMPYNNPYMVPPPGSMSYGNPSEMYSAPTGSRQAGGYGSNGPPQSFSGPTGPTGPSGPSGPSGSSGTPGPYGSYGYNYGFVPQAYPPYNPNTV